MEGNYKDLVLLYENVKRRYLQLKRDAKFIGKDSKNHDDSKSHKKTELKSLPVTKKINHNRDHIKPTTKLMKISFHEEESITSEKNNKCFYEEYYQYYKGNEKQFYAKYKNDLTVMKFLKHILFLQLSSLQCIYPNKRSFKRSISFEQFLKKTLDFINNRATLILFMLCIMMFGYNIIYHFQEIKIEKQILENYRLRYSNESEALYQIQREKHILYERIKRHKDLGMIQSLLSRQINLNFSFILGIVFLIICLLKNFLTSNSAKKQKYNYMNIQQSIFEGLSNSLNQSIIKNEKQEKSQVQNEEFYKNEEYNQNNSKKLSDVYDEGIQQKEQTQQIMLKNQRDYMMKRKEEEQIKRDILEQKKAEMMNELKYLNQQQEKTTEMQNRRKMKSIQFKSQNYNQNYQSNNVKEEKPINFVSNYYNYKKVHQSEDEDYDLPQFGIKNKNPLVNKFQKKSKFIVSKNMFDFQSEPLHVRSKSIGSQFSIINTKNESESYKFCDRPY